MKTNTEQTQEQKIYDILKESPEMASRTMYLVQHGAGTLLSQTLEHLKIEKEKLLAIELADGLALTGSGDWHYEIAQMVLKKDTEKMKKIAQDIFIEDPSCPHCGYASRMTYRKRTKDYICRKCKHTWKF